MATLPDGFWRKAAWLAGDVVVLSVLAAIADSVFAPFWARLVTGVVGAALYVITENNF